MKVEEAIIEAARRAKLEKQSFVVAFKAGDMSPYWRNRYIVYPEKAMYAHTCRLFIITARGKCHVVHHHLRQEGSRDQSFEGLKRDCPICHPEKRGKR